MNNFDNFVEYIVKRKPTLKDLFFKIITIVCCVALSLFFLLFVLHYGSVFLLGVFGAIYLTWFWLKRFSVEYEYIITNNDFDVDKIMGKDRRKRLITVKLNTVDSFGVFSHGADKSAVTVDASDGRGENLWELLCEHEKHGKTRILFSPNQNILVAINRAVPVRFKIAELTKIQNSERVNPDKAAIEAILNPIATRDKGEVL